MDMNCSVILATFPSSSFLYSFIVFAISFITPSMDSSDPVLSGMSFTGVVNSNPFKIYTDWFDLTSRRWREGGVLQKFEGVIVTVSSSNGIFLRTISCESHLELPTRRNYYNLPLRMRPLTVWLRLLCAFSELFTRRVNYSVAYWPSWKWYRRRFPRK